MMARGTWYGDQGYMVWRPGVHGMVTRGTWYGDQGYMVRSLLVYILFTSIIYSLISFDSDVTLLVPAQLMATTETV